MRSFVGLPKMHMAGESFVAGSGVFLYLLNAAISMGIVSGLEFIV